MKNLLLDRALAPNSLDTYKVGIKQYLAFCDQFGINPLPLSEPVLENFCALLGQRIAHKSIKVYLAGVQFYSKIKGGTVLIKNMLRLEYVLMAIRRAQGNSFARPTRTPISLQMLEEIVAFIYTTESPFDRRMLTAAVLLAFFGLLRVSEYTSPSTSNYDSSVHLSLDDVTIDWDRRVALVRIKKSKTDPYRQGVTVRIGILDHYLCPVHALVSYILVRGPSPGPFFRFQNGAFLTRARIVDLLVRSLPHIPNVNTHSFRRGGASALADANTPAHIIQILGRWRSNAYREYIQLTDQFLIQANLNMVRNTKRGS